MQLSQYHLEWMTCNNPDLIWAERYEILMIQYFNQTGIFNTLVLLTNVAISILIMFLGRFPQYLTVVFLALSLFLFRHDQRISTAMCADLAVFHLIGMISSFVGNDKTRLNTIMWIVWALAFLGPTPIVSFTPAMPTSLQHVPNPSLIGPSQIQTKPPTVQPASSPTPVILSVNNQNITRKFPHSQSIRVSNQPQYVETSNFRSLSPVEAVERTPLKESSKIHKCELSDGNDEQNQRTEQAIVGGWRRDSEETEEKEESTSWEHSVAG
ncbi:hypothetical protein BLNAU_23508 [Blattamonas nauphoetae]|uniref:Uncharacterized protein n=1 Tax=Blattamonas nauphoetae TaxID=2049346 RepID=A0ABQ9WQ15_9EUKA|nr:hypothetical protein BLNAU_23508 [Blattamonas nauphoetae]